MNAHNLLLARITELQSLVATYDVAIQKYSGLMKPNLSTSLENFLLSRIAVATGRRESCLNKIIGMREAADIINSHF